MEHHTSPQEVGWIFSRARPKMGAYTHLVLLARDNVRALTTAEVIAQTRETYDGQGRRRPHDLRCREGQGIDAPSRAGEAVIE